MIGCPAPRSSTALDCLLDGSSPIILDAQRPRPTAPAHGTSPTPQLDDPARRLTSRPSSMSQPLDPARCPSLTAHCDISTFDWSHRGGPAHAWRARMAPVRRPSSAVQAGGPARLSQLDSAQHPRPVSPRSHLHARLPSAACPCPGGLLQPASMLLLSAQACVSLCRPSVSPCI